MSSYADKMAISINGGPYTQIDNSTVTPQFPEDHYGGIGGAEPTERFTMPVIAGQLTDGTNTISFKFTHTDGISIGFRILAFNFVRSDGSLVLASTDFVQDNPDTWLPPLDNSTDIAAGKNLWYTAPLSDLYGKPIHAHCTSCHVSDGTDLKYYNYSNYAIEARSVAHGLSQLQGEQIASYIRSLDLGLPSGVTQADLGRPWNPPFQPGPGLDAKPQIEWPAGAGLDWVLDSDIDTLSYMFPDGLTASDAASIVSADSMFNQREIPIAMQLPDWNHWLPIIHPLDSTTAVYSGDIYTAFSNSLFERGYEHMDADFSQGGNGDALIQQTHDNLIDVTNGSSPCPGGIESEFNLWFPYYLLSVSSDDSFYITATKDDPSLDMMSSRQLYLVRQWELHVKHGLFDRAHDAYPLNNGRAFMYNDWLAFGVSPHVSMSGQLVYPFDTPVKEQYWASAWYELQRVINTGNKAAHPGGPIDWNYQTPQLVDLTLKSGVNHGAMLALDEFSALQQAASPPWAWEACNGSVSFLYVPKNSMPPWFVFEHGLDCEGPDWLWEFDTTTWNELETLALNSFMNKMEQRSNWANWPRYQSIMPDSSFVPSLNTTNTDKCSSSDVSVPLNAYQSLQYFQQNGVDPTTIQRFSDWGSALWPLADWNYWKQ